MPATFKSICAVLFFMPAALAQRHGALRASSGGNLQRLMTKDLPVPRDWLAPKTERAVAAEGKDEDFSASYNFHPPTDTGAEPELPAIDDSGAWQARLSLLAKKELLEEVVSDAADKLKALLAAAGYTGSVEIKIGKQARRRLPWDTSRLLQQNDKQATCTDGVYIPVSITGDADLTAATAKSVIFSADFSSIFSDPSLVCGIKLYDFRVVNPLGPVGPYVPTIDCGATELVVLGNQETAKVYALTSDITGTVTFSTCDPATTVDTALTVYGSNPLADASATVLASNDDDVTCADDTKFSTVSIKVDKGTTLYVSASTTYPYGGDISLTASCGVY